MTYKYTRRYILMLGVIYKHMYKYGYLEREIERERERGRERWSDRAAYKEIDREAKSSSLYLFFLKRSN